MSRFRTAADEVIAKMPAMARIRFLLFRFDMMERYRLTLDKFSEPEVIDRTLQRFMEGSTSHDRLEVTKAHAIISEMLAMGWGPITPEAKRAEEQRRAAEPRYDWRY